jgi:CPA1 family monovalent cation:H+ antiporter
MSPTTIENMAKFWELLDESMNAVLFVQIGAEVLTLAFTGKLLLLGLIAIPVVLLARLASVAGQIAVVRRHGGSPNTRSGCRPGAGCGAGSPSPSRCRFRER